MSIDNPAGKYSKLLESLNADIGTVNDYILNSFAVEGIKLCTACPGLIVVRVEIPTEDLHTGAYSQADTFSKVLSQIAELTSCAPCARKARLEELIAEVKLFVPALGARAKSRISAFEPTRAELVEIFMRSGLIASPEHADNAAALFKGYEGSLVQLAATARAL